MFLAAVERLAVQLLLDLIPVLFLLACLAVQLFLILSFFRILGGEAFGFLT